mgnify:CR=1 FL=1
MFIFACLTGKRGADNKKLKDLACVTVVMGVKRYP